jgi:hypothetical protein
MLSSDHEISKFRYLGKVAQVYGIEYSIDRRELFSATALEELRH